MKGMLTIVRSNIRALGRVNGALYLLAAAIARVSRGRARLIKYDLVVQPVVTEPLLPAHRGRAIEVREAGPGDPSLEAVPGRRDGVMAERFGWGARCLVACLHGDLAGFLWYLAGDYPEDEVRCTFRALPNGEGVWDFDVYVDERHRLSPVFLRLWQAANAQLAAEGVRHSCSRISAFNPASRGSHARLGARKVGWATFLVAGPWQLTLADRRPYLHLSMSERSRPVIEVGPGA